MTASLAHRIAPYLAGVLAIAGACLVPPVASASAPAVAGLVNAGPARPDVNGISAAPAWSFESNIVNAFLGMSAAVAGDVNGDGFDDAVAYASSGGRLWLFFGGPSGPTLAPGFPATIPIDGSHVAAAGDVNGDGFADVVAGWPGATFGTIRVYNGGPSGLNLASPFVLFQNFSNNFGQYVGTAGDVNGDGYDEVIVGSPGFPGNVSLCGTTSSTGKVDVFYGSASGLNPDPAVNWVLMGCRHVANGGAMGTAAATAGDVNGDGYDDIVVGAPGATVGVGGTPHGSAWVIYGSASKLPLTPGFSNLGTLAGSTRLDSPTAFASFGSGAITAGDVNADGYADVAVGAPTDDTFASDAGFVRVYPGGPGGVSTTEMWWESSSFANTRMGHRLVPAGDVNGDRRGDLLVGTSGGALLGTSIGNSLLFVQGLTVPHAFGTAGDVNGDGFSDVLVTDAYWANGQALEGRITFHSGVGETGRALVWSFIQGVEVNPNMGWSVSSAGDVNGDGYDDVLVGSPTADNVGAGQTDNGTVELYLGAPGALSPSAAFSAFGSPSDQLGIAVAPVGDVNGDGYCDVAAGAHQGGVGNGKVLVWYGGPSAPFPGAVPNVVLNGPSPGSQFGAALTGGDFNGDGYADVAVGAPYDDVTVRFITYTDGGRVFVYYGGPAGLSSSPANVFFMAEDNAHFGAAVAGGADTDGDSYTELIIGAPDHDAPAPPFTLPDAGSVFEYGRSGSTALTFRRTVGHGISFDRFGASLAHAGDVDGDGYGDIIVGATGAVNTLQGEGGAWVFHGGAAGLDPAPLWAQAGGEVNGAFGSSVSGAGDVNGDGLSDVLVGAVFQDAGGAQDRGTARVYLGPLTAGTPAAWTGFGPGTFANMGHCVANAGDVDGDGWPDLVFGEPGFTNTAFREGKIELYAGAWGLAPPAVTHAVRASGPIAPLGLTDVGAMTFQHEARSAAGRTGVKLAWRLTSTLIGVPAPTIAGMQGSYTPTGPILGSGSQASLSQGVSGLKSGFPYAWQVRTRSRSVYFPTTKWTSFARNGALEWDVRVPGSLDAPVATTAAPELMLSAPTPNPSRGLSWVRFALPRATRVSLVVYDAQGRRVRQVVDGPMAAGPHEARWDGARDDGTRAGTGVYFYRFEADGARSSRRLVLIH